MLLGPHPINGICQTPAFPYGVLEKNGLMTSNSVRIRQASCGQARTIPDSDLHAFFGDFSGAPSLCTAALSSGGATPKHVPVCVLALHLTNLLLEGCEAWTC